MGEWRPIGERGWFIADPSLDQAIESLSPVARRLLAQGVNLTYAQAQALSPQPGKNPCDSGFDGEETSPPEPEQYALGSFQP